MTKSLILIFILFAVGSCGGRQHGPRSAPPQEFCTAIVAGRRDDASASAHAALVAAGAGGLADATDPLARWLRAQPCIADVTVPTEVVDTEPGIREIGLVLVADDAGLMRRCVADLRLAPGARVGVRPSVWITPNPTGDDRCTPLATRTTAGSRRVVTRLGASSWCGAGCGAAAFRSAYASTCARWSAITRSSSSA